MHGYGDFDELDEGNYSSMLNGADWPPRADRVRRLVGGNTSDSSTGMSISLHTSQISLRLSEFQ